MASCTREGISSPFVARYDCISSDKTEIWLKEGEQGHGSFDFDGDSSDPDIRRAIEIKKTTIEYQTVFSNSPGDMRSYSILRVFERENRAYTLLAYSSEFPDEMLQVKIAPKAEWIGVMTVAMSASEPVLLNGKRQVSSVIDFAVCVSLN